MTPEGMGLIEWIALGGSTVGCKADAASAGVTSVTIQATGTGKIADNSTIYFQGDDTPYQVTTGLADVSVGGTITISPGLKVALSAGTPVYTGGELRRGWGHNAWYQPSGIITGNIAPVYRDWFEAGDIAQLWLDYGYSKLDHKHEDTRTRSSTKSGITQLTYLSTTEVWILGMSMIVDARGNGIRSDFVAIETYVDAWVHGQPMIWFPDYENNPDEYLWCVLDKRSEPQRIGNIGLYRMDFILRVEPSFSATIPTFA